MSRKNSSAATAGSTGSEGTQASTGSEGTQASTGSEGTQASTGSEGTQGSTKPKGTRAQKQEPQVADFPFDRAAAISRLTSERFDLVVIGGGITGAGVALDAASRGLKTALIEKDDLASGTSSKSSKLVHGGLRYLEQREFRLVYESLHERQRLLDNAPHLVEPQPFLIPLFGKDGVANKALARTYMIALWLYDITGGLRIGKRHKRISTQEAASHMPTLRTDKLAAGFIYYDARVDDARLTLTIARTAAVEHGATVANYVKATGLVKDPSGRITGVKIEGPGIGRANVIETLGAINATGVWADQIRSLDEGDLSHSIRPAKGIHITVPHDKLPCDIASVIPVRRDRRSIFVIPWAWGGQTYIGTTDTDYDGPIDDPECTSEDVAYLLDAVNAYVTEPLTSDDVTGMWAGLRPLVASGPKSKSARTADLSRVHRISVSPDGMVTVTGGKLTTYRLMASDTVDRYLKVQGRTPLKCLTKKMPLLGAAKQGHPEISKLAASLGLDEQIASHLYRRYGTMATDVLKPCISRPELLEPMAQDTDYLMAEALYAVKSEMAQTLEDVLARRTRALILEQAGTLASANKVAALIAPELGWDRDECERQVKEFAKLATHRSGLAGILVGTETTTRIDNKQRSAAFASGNAKPEAAKGSATSATKPNKKGKS